MPPFIDLFQDNDGQVFRPLIGGGGSGGSGGAETALDPPWAILGQYVDRAFTVNRLNEGEVLTPVLVRGSFPYLNDSSVDQVSWTGDALSVHALMGSAHQKHHGVVQFTSKGFDAPPTVSSIAQTYDGLNEGGTTILGVNPNRSTETFFSVRNDQGSVIRGFDTQTLIERSLARVSILTSAVPKASFHATTGRVCVKFNNRASVYYGVIGEDTVVDLQTVFSSSNAYAAPTFSADGSRMVLARSSSTGPEMEVLLFDVDDGGVVETYSLGLHRSDNLVAHPLDADLFMSRGASAGIFFRITSSTYERTVRPLPRSWANSWFEWSPDGRKVFYTDGPWIRVVDFDPTTLEVTPRPDLTVYSGSDQWTYKRISIQTLT